MRVSLRPFVAIVLALLIALTSPLGAAWGTTSNHGANAVKSAGTTMNWDLPSSTTINNLVVLFIGFDNTSTGDAQTSEVTSVVDGTANTYTKFGEFVNGQGTAGAGIGISVWGGIQTASFGGTGTITFANSITAKSYSAYEYSKAAGAVCVEALSTAATDGADFPSVNNTVTNVSHLWLRGIGWEQDWNAAGGLNTTASFTNIDGDGTSGGAADSNASVWGEFRIFTGTTNASDPQWTGTQADNASVYVTLTEGACAGGGAAKPMRLLKGMGL